MARIEEENSRDKKVVELQRDLEKLKKGLKRKQNKRILSCTSCFLFFLFLVLVAAGFCSYVLAKSGIMTIPYLSERIFQEPRPAYIVQAGSLSMQEKDILSILKNKLTESVSNINDVLNSKITLQLSDVQLSAMFKDQVSQNESLKSYIDYLQVAVLPQNLELFIKLKKPKNTILVLEIVPRVNNQKINLQVKSFKIGNLSMPGFIGQALIATFGAKILNMIIAPFSSFGQLQQIRLDYGKVLIDATITNLKGLF
jgi:hypothetical protein